MTTYATPEPIIPYPYDPLNRLPPHLRQPVYHFLWRYRRLRGLYYQNREQALLRVESSLPQTVRFTTVSHLLLLVETPTEP